MIYIKFIKLRTLSITIRNGYTSTVSVKWRWNIDQYNRLFAFLQEYYTVHTQFNALRPAIHFLHGINTFFLISSKLKNGMQCIYWVLVFI